MKLTRIDILIILVILGILAAIVIPEFKGMKKEIEVAAEITDVNAVDTNLAGIGTQ